MTSQQIDPIAREDDARVLVYQALRGLRYSAQVKQPMPDISNSHQFLIDALSWLAEFRAVLNTVADTVSDMESELHQLRSQREAIRSFLGTTKGTT